MSEPRVIAVLRELNALQDGSKGKYRLEGVDPKTLKRWLEGESHPRGDSVVGVAERLWRRWNQSGGDAARRAAYEAIRGIVPAAPCETWTEDTFRAWFFQLAEQTVDPGPVDVRLDLRVWRPACHRFVSVREPGGRPIRGGDRVRVEATVRGTPMHLYLVWVTMTREGADHAPFHPVPAGWDAFASPEAGSDRPSLGVAYPAVDDEGWPMESRNGTETLILLARATPLTTEQRRSLRADFTTLVDRVRLGTRPQAGDFLHEYAHPESRDAGEPPADARLPIFGNPVKVDDPIHQLVLGLRRQWAGCFAAIRMLTIVNAGDEANPT